MDDRELKPQQDDELDDAVQEAALTAWRIEHDRKRAERLERWRRWAAAR